MCKILKLTIFNEAMCFWSASSLINSMIAVSHTIHDFFMRTDGIPDPKKLLSANLPTHTCAQIYSKITEILKAKIWSKSNFHTIMKISTAENNPYYSTVQSWFNVFMCLYIYIYIA